MKKLVSFMFVLITWFCLTTYCLAEANQNILEIPDIRFQKVNSVVLLDDNTFLIAGRADSTGVCLVMDQHGKILRTYHIESPYSEGGASVVGATIVGDQIVAATYDYETNKSFFVLLGTDSDAVITEEFNGQIEAVASLDGGLLVCGSYYNNMGKEVPWAAKVDEEGVFAWTFEVEAIQTNVPGGRKYFEFCADLGEGYVLLQHEALGYPNGHIYTQIQLTKDGECLSSKALDLPKMEYGCLFADIAPCDEEFILYGSVYNSEYQYIATTAAIDISAEVLWIQEYEQVVAVTAAANLHGLTYCSIAIRDPSKVIFLVLDSSGNIIDVLDDPFGGAFSDISISFVIPDKEDGLWVAGLTENLTRCFITKLK